MSMAAMFRSPIEKKLTLNQDYEFLLILGKEKKSIILALSLSLSVMVHRNLSSRTLGFCISS